MENRLLYDLLSIDGWHVPEQCMAQVTVLMALSLCLLVCTTAMSGQGLFSWGRLRNQDVQEPFEGRPVFVVCCGGEKTMID